MANEMVFFVQQCMPRNMQLCRWSPKSLRIEVIDATLQLDQVSYFISPESQSVLLPLQPDQVRLAQNSE